MNTPVITASNLNKICRICLLESEKMHSVFSPLDSKQDNDSICIQEFLMSISSIKIESEDDQMPTAVCTTCLRLASVSYKFQQQCNKSQAILEKYLMQLFKKKVFLKAEEKKYISYTDTYSGTFKDETINYIDLESSAGIAEEIIINDINEDLDIDLDNIKEEEQIVICNATSDSVKIQKKSIAPKVNNDITKKRMRRKSLCNLSGNKRNYNTKMTDEGSQVYACKLCDKVYKYGSSIKVHMRTHTSERVERPYGCSICGKDFIQFSSLKYHFRSHSGEQPYKCVLCGKKYRHSGSLKAHMRVHTGQKPFLCSICGRGFRQAPELGYHMRTHTKEKPYMCSICGKTMAMQCHLVQHMRSHTGERPFKCKECDKAFPSTTRLKRHAIIHTGLKPYKCQVCQKSFNRQTSLQVHSKIHTDDRPHVCSVCGKRFIQSHSLRTHLGTHQTSFNENEAS